MSKLLTKKEIQKEELAILKDVIKFMDDNNLNYSLAGGTLLGAIRHKGFIPWDDDIDLLMSRNEYDKFLKLFKENNNISGTSLYVHSNELNNLNLPYTKVYNKNIFAHDERFNDKYEKYLWIDIFPLDGFSDDIKECEKIYNKKQLYRRLLLIRKSTFNYIFTNSKNIIKMIGKLFIKLLLHLLPSSYFANRITKLAKNYSYDDSRYVGNISWGYGLKERIDKKLYEELILMKFEDIKAKGYKEYDKILTEVYGDYMTLPPEEERKTHDFEAWRIENEK